MSARTHPLLDTTLGLDLGTSSVKAVLVSGEGETLAEARRDLTLLVPEEGAAEQEAEEWWSATVSAIRGCLSNAGGAKVTAVGLTGQKHAFLPLDDGGAPLDRAILWADGRATGEAAELARLEPRLARRTGAPALPGYLVPKWRRWSRADPERAARTAHLCFAKDWLRFRLTDAFATDPTEASASQLYDARRQTWSEELCRRFDVPFGLLPPLRPSNAVTGRVTVEAAVATGLDAGTPVVGGAGDNEAAALACGAVEPGVVAVVLGTSGTILAPAARRRAARGIFWGRHATRRGLTATGVVLSAGRALDWVRRAVFGERTSITDVVAAAERVPPDASLPLFLPSLAGERSPEPDPDATGAFWGLRPEHGRDHLARAVLEGVALSLGQVIDRLRGAGVPVREIRFTSGGAASAAWRRWVLAAAGVPGRPAGAVEGPARGAALLAAAAGETDTRLLARVSSWVVPGPISTVAEAEVARARRTSERLARLREASRAVR